MWKKYHLFLIMSCQFKKTLKRNILGIWMKEKNLFTNDTITYRKIQRKLYPKY